MRAVWWFRAAAIVLIAFAALHTVGFLGFRPPTPEGEAVWDSMQRVHFAVKGSSFSYGDFYVGFGLFATVFLLLSAYLAWTIGGISTRTPEVAAHLGWALFAAQIAGLALSWMYFSAGPAIFSGIVAVCFGWGAVCSQSRGQTHSRAITSCSETPGI
jgi:hypothetical protein